MFLCSKTTSRWHFAFDPSVQLRNTVRASVQEKSPEGRPSGLNENHAVLTSDGGRSAWQQHQVRPARKRWVPESALYRDGTRCQSQERLQRASEREQEERLRQFLCLSRRIPDSRG